MDSRSSWFGVGLASFSTIAVELMLTRIFSVTMYYHFAFMVISLALLGIAIAGVTVYLLPGVFRRERVGIQAAFFTLLFAIGSAFALRVALAHPIGLGRWRESSEDLLTIYFASAFPFLMSGFAITLAISWAGKAIGRVYAFDLVGAALGCVAVLPLLSGLGAPSAILVTAGFACVGAVCFALSGEGRGSKAVAGLAALVGVALVGLGSTEGSAHRFGDARNPSKFLGTREVLFERWNAFSHITVGAGEADHRWIFIDADAATRMWSGSVAEQGFEPTRRVPEIRVASLAYALRNGGTALVIGPGGGTDVISALYRGVRRVVGVEVNPIIAETIMGDVYAEYSGRLYADPRVDVHVDEGRSFVRRAPGRFATIQATLVDTWAASSSGAFTLSENNIYTLEAFEEFLEHLEDDGVITFTRWYDPRRPQEFLRLLSIGRAALEARGVAPEDVRRHFFVATDGQRRTTMLLGRSPFTDEDVRVLVEAAGADRLRVLYGAGVEVPGVRRLDPQVVALVEAADLRQYLAGLSFDASPPSDDRPFFFYTLFPEQLLDLARRPDGVAINDLGAVILLALLALSAGLTSLFVVGPLVLFRRSVLRTDRAAKLRVLGYFLALGLAFILVEIGLMQRFVLFLGHPIYSLAVVLATLLAASGIGSALSDRGREKLGTKRFVTVGTGTLVAVLVAYALALTPLFHALLGLPIEARVAIAVALVFVPGLLMGTLLPSGVRAASSISPDLVPWGWGLNGATSVVGSILAVFLSMNYGFTVALAIGLAVYALVPFLLPAEREGAA